MIDYKSDLERIWILTDILAGYIIINEAMWSSFCRSYPCRFVSGAWRGWVVYGITHGSPCGDIAPLPPPFILKPRIGVVFLLLTDIFVYYTILMFEGLFL